MANVGLCVWTYVYVRAFAYVYVYEVYLLVYMHRNYVYTCSDMRLHEYVYMCVCVYLHVSEQICACLRSLSASSHQTEDLFGRPLTVIVLFNVHVSSRELYAHIHVHVLRM